MAFRKRSRWYQLITSNAEEIELQPTDRFFETRASCDAARGCEILDLQPIRDLIVNDPVEAAVMRWMAGFFPALARLRTGKLYVSLSRLTVRLESLTYLAKRWRW